MIRTSDTRFRKPLLYPPELQGHASRSIITPNNPKEQRSSQNRQSYPATRVDHRFSLKQAIGGYLLSCKVEGKSLATIVACKSKLYPFLWYAKHYNLPDEIMALTTQHIREFLAYLRDNEVRFGGNHIQSRKGCQQNHDSEVLSCIV